MIVTQGNPGLGKGIDRAAIDGWVAFATAAFLLGAGIFVLLDRIGAPERFVYLLGPTLAATGLATIGFMLRSMRISSFRAAGRALPGAYAGLAIAALGAGLAMSFTPSGPAEASLASLLAGLGAGLLLSALWTGPLLRKTGAFSISGLLVTRFPSLTLRVGATLTTGAVGLCIGLAGLAMAQQSLAQAALLNPQSSALLVAAVVAAIVVPGGMAGLVWSATGAAGLLIAGVAAPLLLIIASGAAIPLPVLGDRMAFEQALAQMAQWRGGSNAGAVPDALIILGLMLGVAALGPLLAPAIATPRPPEARRGGLLALVWCALMGLMAIVVAAASTQSLLAGGAGVRPGELPAFLLEASGHGFVGICGRHPQTIAQAREACAAMPGFAGLLRASDITATSDFLLLGLAQLRGFGAAFSGLAMAGRVAIALVLSAAGFLTLATALGENANHRMQAASGLTSRRLAATRLILLAAIAGCAAQLVSHQPDPRLLIGAALALSAVAVAPLLLLSLWARAQGLDGAIALVTGLAVTEAIILLAGEPAQVSLVAAASVAGFAAAVLAGFGASFLHPADPTSEAAAFVHGLLHGEGDVLDPDKGA